MKRKDFLKGFSWLGLGALAPLRSTASPGPKLPLGPQPPNCTLIPTETAGPFPLDLTENQEFFRQDVTEGREGVQLNQKIKIIGAENCLPMPNVRVNIWHCDKDGKYSGYGAEEGETYMRGYQITDANGEVEFKTILPGWYPGRTCHIHFQAYVSSVYAAISQLTYPNDVKNEIYEANADVYTRGVDPINFENDGAFADGYMYQLATLTPNKDTGGYDSYLEVTIEGSGLTSLAKAEPETGGVFTLSQNQPNPYKGHTTIPFALNHPADAYMEIWDFSGQKLAEIKQPGLSPGNHIFEFDALQLGLPSDSYVYQLRVVYNGTSYRQAKVMTVIQ